MSTTASTTYIIPNPEAVKSRYRLNEEEQEKNRIAYDNTRFVLIEFLKAAAGFYQAGLSFEWSKGSYGAWQLMVNGHQVHYKFAEKWIMIENGGSNGRNSGGFYKMSTQLYYSKNLTIKEHGKKAIEVIGSMVARIERKRIAAENSNNNAHIAAHAMKYLATKHGFKIREDEERGDGYWPSSSESSISASYRLGQAVCSFTFSTTPDNFGKITMNIIRAEWGGTLNFNGTYVLGGLHTKFAQMQETVNAFEHEFSKIVKFWPEAVAYVKEHGDSN